MRLLLHVCCAPCLIHPLSVLSDEGHNIAIFFFNPNIDSQTEHDKRLEHLKRLAFQKNLALEEIAYNPRLFSDRINEDLKDRCRLCYDIRLETAARFAKENGFDAFSTTLLVSPYQDQELLREAGEAAAAKEGTGFFFKDFRDGFRKAQNEARELGIYLQNYCGCSFSRKEMRERRLKR